MKPIKVHLSVTDALTVNVHSEVFKLNGFKIRAAESEGSNCFEILSLPYSKKVMFDVNDFHELLQKVNENQDMKESPLLTVVSDRSKRTNEGDKLMHKEVLRPKKVYAMLASRACRQSIMIGRDLDHKTMRKVVTNLTTLESPWNCPHGRPTLRFLKKLDKEVRDGIEAKGLPSRGRTV
jgi:DNA mismatch repair protein PMS2